MNERRARLADQSKAGEKDKKQTQIIQQYTYLNFAHKIPHIIPQPTNHTLFLLDGSIRPRIPIPCAFLNLCVFCLFVCLFEYSTVCKSKITFLARLHCFNINHYHLFRPRVRNTQTIHKLTSS